MRILKAKWSDEMSATLGGASLPLPKPFFTTLPPIVDCCEQRSILPQETTSEQDVADDLADGWNSNPIGTTRRQRKSSVYFGPGEG